MNKSVKASRLNMCLLIDARVWQDVHCTIAQKAHLEVMCAQVGGGSTKHQFTIQTVQYHEW